MNTPCEKTEIIHEIHLSVKDTQKDVKLLLANHHKAEGARILRKRWFNKIIAIGTLITGILAAIKIVK